MELTPEMWAVLRAGPQRIALEATATTVTDAQGETSIGLVFGVLDLDQQVIGHLLLTMTADSATALFANELGSAIIAAHHLNTHRGAPP